MTPRRNHASPAGQVAELGPLCSGCDVKSRRRNFFIVAAIALVAAVVVWALWPVGREFDRAVWLDEKQEGPRLKMADRIVSRRMLDGKARAEVVAMLGEPPKTGYFSDWNLVYWLGPERGFISIDSEWLVVRFDAHERVSDCRIVRD